MGLPNNGGASLAGAHLVKKTNLNMLIFIVFGSQNKDRRMLICEVKKQ
jgi:hypothetical protein